MRYYIVLYAHGAIHDCIFEAPIWDIGLVYFKLLLDFIVGTPTLYQATSQTSTMDITDLLSSWLSCMECLKTLDITLFWISSFKTINVFFFFFVFINFGKVLLYKWPLKEVTSSKVDVEVNSKGTYLKKYSILCKRGLSKVFLC